MEVNYQLPFRPDSDGILLEALRSLEEAGVLTVTAMRALEIVQSKRGQKRNLERQESQTAGLSLSSGPPVEQGGVTAQAETYFQNPVLSLIWVPDVTRSDSLPLFFPSPTHPSPHSSETLPAFMETCEKILSATHELFSAPVVISKLMACVNTLKELANKVLVNLHAPRKFLRLNTENKKLREMLSTELSPMAFALLSACDFRLTDRQTHEALSSEPLSFSVTKLLILKRLLQVDPDKDKNKKIEAKGTKTSLAGAAALARFSASTAPSPSNGPPGHVSLLPSADRLASLPSLLRLYRSETFSAWAGIFKQDWDASAEAFMKAAGRGPPLPRFERSGTQQESNVENMTRQQLRQILNGAVGGGGGMNIDAAEGEEGVERFQCVSHRGLGILTGFLLFRRYGDAAGWGIRMQSKEEGGVGMGVRMDGKVSVHGDFFGSFFRATDEDVASLLRLLPVPSGVRVLVCRFVRRLAHKVFFPPDPSSGVENEKNVATEIVEAWTNNGPLSDLLKGGAGGGGSADLSGSVFAVSCLFDAIEGVVASLGIFLVPS
uniref:Uncharacterized protein n=1 Tax=Chromera velia CCMP2878 TaxID=1169474 RepID=A0A0G4FN75_9ALVE|eukprot:Cvel_17697.t1-p1 / transcript=Cvel_17697.t1 / gene=Cvel_17697 / organism=Chromera_velia_CCMP2878 / gene_product=hypothetical protein / transcript_product=hypothetical protein / location=Cvel_scaffold1428:37156-38796(+) / protein_length=547 / sequence_SO=supercontig / SO=protein_coding / is_pseudo=false